MSPARIALFLCDTPIDSVVKTDGDYRDIYGVFLRDSLPDSKEETPAEYVIDSFDVRYKQEYPENIDTYDTIVMTGSAASVYENLDWINRLISYIRDLVHNKKHIKLIGICFGHQIIARALDYECVPNTAGWEVGITELSLTPVGQKLFNTSALNIQQMHRDHVPGVPSGFQLLGDSPITPNQGMVKFYSEAEEIDNVHILTLQGHPEYTRRIVDAIVKARGENGVMSPDVVEDARRRADWRNDGVSVIGKVIWQVVLGRR